MAQTEEDLMAFLTDACSICFENRCEFSFPRCQDQFCVDCISKYFKEVISNSWGLSVVTMKCPVCYDVLPKHVWSKYVDTRTLLRYERFNRPYRGLSRFCERCGFENAAVQPPALTLEDAETIIRALEDTLKQDLGCGPEVLGMLDSYLASILLGQASVTDLYFALDNQLRDQRPPLSAALEEAFGVRSRRVGLSYRCSVAHALSLVIRLETNPARWKELQEKHIHSFPKTTCGRCRAPLCFQCGEPTWHEMLTCEANLKNYLQLLQGDTERAATIQWKLANSKRCPSCAILINREEGCNKVDCLYCGLEFCWVCLGAWSEKCGFFKCSLEKTSNKDAEDAVKEPHHKVHANEKPEIGVPNVTVIERQLANVISTQQERRRSTSVQQTPSNQGEIATASSSSSSVAVTAVVPLPLPPSDSAIKEEERRTETAPAPMEESEEPAMESANSNRNLSLIVSTGQVVRARRQATRAFFKDWLFMSPLRSHHYSPY